MSATFLARLRATSGAPKPASDTIQFLGHYDAIHRVFRAPDGRLLFRLQDILPEEAGGETVGFFRITVEFQRKP